MDYTTTPLLFKLRKAARYVRIYGIRRTVAKIDAQYHMKRSYESLPSAIGGHPHGHVGIIGCGNFAFSNIAYYLKKNYGNVVRGAMDVDATRAASLFQRYDATYYTDDAERIISDPEIDLVYIASNHSSHAEYAIRALERGKSVHIEKPHVVNLDQLRRLVGAMRAHPGKVALGFNRPGSVIGQEIRACLDAQPGPAMLNWFVAGHAIPAEHWYFREAEGGRVLGNLCHWTDFIYQMVPPAHRYPIVIRPTRASQSRDDIAVTFTFGDGTIGAITFSAKGHTFEGVREQLSAHKGDALISMVDFVDLTIELVHDRRVHKKLFRDHGHERAIQRSYDMVQPNAEWQGCSPEYVWETGELFLMTKQAIDQEKAITLSAFDETKLSI